MESATSDIQNAYEVKDKRRAAISDGFTKDGIYYPYKFINTYVDIAAGARAYERPRSYSWKRYRRGKPGCALLVIGCDFVS